MVKENLVHCTKISVDCVENDPVEVSNGEAEYLGWDFNVPEEETEHTKKFIMLALDKFEIPFINIYESGEVDLRKKEVHTEEAILKQIAKDAKYIKKVAASGYSKVLK